MAAPCAGRNVWSVDRGGQRGFVPSTNGTFRAFDGQSGRVLWKARPGAPIAGGATVADGAVLIGYGVQFGLYERAVNPPAGSRGGIVAYRVRR